MNKLLIAGLLTVTALSTTLQANAASITEAMNLAVTTHPEVLVAGAEQQAIGQRILQARAGYKPTLDFAAGTGYEWSKNSSTRFRAARTPGSGKQGSRDMWRNEARLNASQMLFDGFQTKSRIGAETAREAAATFRVMDIKNQIALRAAEAYLMVLRAQEQIALAQTNVETHQSYLAKIQNRATGGRSAQADIEQVQGRLAQAMANVEAARGDLRQAEANYLEAVGEMPNGLAKDATPFSAVPADTTGAIGRAMANSPVIAAARKNIQAANAQVAEAKCLFCPKITAEGGISRNWNLDGVDGPNHDATAMLMWRQNFYNGGRDVAQRDERIALVGAAEAKLEQERRLVEKSVIDAMARLDAAKNRLEPLNRYVQAATTTRDAYVAQFDLGQRSLLDLLDSEVELTSAKAGVIDGKFELDAAAYAVLAHMGDLVPSTTQMAAK
ncbi:MAG: TolC family outer membrane protein [Alphaproteobacteria bacterium]|jgi:adhesin transport system outer membrane protein|nr:TolC family outer membrane protein [Alphaproteobacteria bacterium]